MSNDNPEIANIEVPHTPRPEIDLAKEYRRVSEELSWLKQELTDAADQLLADQITIGESGVHVRYNPNTPQSMNSAKPLSREFGDDYRFLYGGYEDQDVRAGRTSAMQGLQDFEITPDGGLSVSIYERVERKKFLWSTRRPAFPEELNEALKGLVSQHDELIALGQTHPVIGVVVPTMSEA